MPAAPVRPAVAPSQRCLEWTLAAGLLGSAWLLDPAADAVFDAPKRFITLLAAALGAITLIFGAGLPAWRDWSRSAWGILACLGVAGLGLVLATLASPHPALARDALRAILLYALFLPIGASAPFPAVRERLLYVGMLAVALNAAISLLQAAGVDLPLPALRFYGRFPTGALLGNEGYVALTAAFAACACVAVLMHAPRAGVRNLAWLVGLLCVAAIVVNRQVTAALVLAAGLLVLAALRRRSGWMVEAGAVLVMVLVAAAVLPSLRAVSLAEGRAEHWESYQGLTAYRLSAWAAAQDMVATRPWLGYGPGSFGAEAQPHRLAAEIALRQRLLVPYTASAFVDAHQDYLQLAAEAGVPALVALLGAFATLYRGLLRRALSTQGLEEALLLAVLAGGAVAALAWFPMQIPFTACLLLLACGRAFRLVAMRGAAA